MIIRMYKKFHPFGLTGAYKGPVSINNKFENVNDMRVGTISHVQNYCMGVSKLSYICP